MNETYFGRYKAIAFERQGRVLRVTLNKPETLNAVDDDLHRELSTVFDDANRDPACDVVVLTGAGRAFCAGGDAAWMQTMIDEPAAFRHIATDAKRIVFSLLEMEKPIVCRLNGAAAGLGATVALMCDVIVAADTAVIGDPHVKMGFVAGDGGAVIWPQLIGYARAKEFLMTGEMLTAERAERIGLVNYVVPAAELDAKVDALVKRLVEGPTLAIRWTKTVANIPLRRLAHELMDASVAYEMMSNASADHQEAVNAFREKRKARFTGR
jgi:enoyl-CoA hydratase